MKKSLLKDSYPFLARIQPVLIVLAPLFILGITFSFEFEKYIHVLTSIGVYSVLSFLVAELGRDSGLKKQDNLWASWGGPYTTQLLRWNNPTLPQQTKLDYYYRLEKAFPLHVFFDYLADNDDIYAFWTGKLIQKTRDKKKYPLVYAENVSYGFRRNLWGMKSFAIILTIVTSLFIMVYYLYQSTTIKMTHYPLAFWIIEILNIILMLFWVFVVNTDWIKMPSIAYAKRLLSNS
jgi:hypothetical protein